MRSIIFIFLVAVSMISCKTKSALIADQAYVNEIEHHRAEYKQDFLKDERSPLRSDDFRYMHFFPANKEYNCECDYKATPDAKPFQMSTVSGKTKIFTKHGIATCNINGKSTDVNIYASHQTISMPGYEDYLFIPYKDLTSGESTYGGGRYIDLKTGDIKDGKITIDFNKCYNPWCMYSDGYNCPIPPSENHLDVAIMAGEKIWTGEKKH